MDGLATVCTHSPFQDLTRSFSGRGMYHNSATHPEGLHMIVREERREEVTGVVVGSKTTDEVGCLNTLMNSLNEVISVTFAPS